MRAAGFPAAARGAQRDDGQRAERRAGRQMDGEVDRLADQHRRMPLFRVQHMQPPTVSAAPSNAPLTNATLATKTLSNIAANPFASIELPMETWYSTAANQAFPHPLHT